MTVKVTKASICKILGKPLKIGDTVKTKAGHIGTVRDFTEHGVVIQSAATTQEFARSTICEVLDRA